MIFFFILIAKPMEVKTYGTPRTESVQSGAKDITHVEASTTGTTIAGR